MCNRSFWKWKININITNTYIMHLNLNLNNKARKVPKAFKGYKGVELN